MTDLEALTEEKSTAVDAFFADLFVGTDPELDAAIADSRTAGLPEIQVSATQGKLLHLLARMRGAQRILEIGTLGGYSTIQLARALPPDGRLISLEFESKHAEVARANLARAGLAERVEIRVGRALDLLPGIEREGVGPFDLVFVDADKENNPHYFDWALKLSRLGTLILVDNVVRDGDVLDASSKEPSTVGTRRLLERMASEPRVTAAALQTVGAKGWDGVAVALVIA
jgi:predicted O-methyltransferase YrrM